MDIRKALRSITGNTERDKSADQGEDVPASTTRAQTSGGADRFSSDYDFPTFEWAGFQWAVRHKNDVITWGGPQAPDPADDEGKWVDGATVTNTGDLVLRSAGVRGGVEIVTVDSLGYGTYRFVYSADFNAMDPHNVLGIFPYDWAEMVLNREEEVHVTADGATEVDFIEISRWGDLDRARPHGGVTYWPDDGKTVAPESHVVSEFDIPPGYLTLTTVAVWEADYLQVATTTADGTVLSEVTATNRIPADMGTQQLHINLWTTQANAPAYRDAQPDQATFHSFEFIPSA